MISPNPGPERHHAGFGILALLGADPDVQVPTDLAMLVAAVDRVAAGHLRYKRGPATRAAYAGDWRAWCRFTAGLGVPATTVSTGLVVAFVEVEARRGAAPATLTRRVAGITATLFDEYKVQVSRDVARAAAYAIALHRRRLADAGPTPPLSGPRPEAEPDRSPYPQVRSDHAHAEVPAALGKRGQAPPMLYDDLLRVGTYLDQRAADTSLPDRLRLLALRDKALMTVQFGIGGRLWVTVRSSQTGVESATVAVEPGRTPATCALTA